MAIRQYIGARYVPRFMGTYDATQQYEVLDVADNGLGTSYVLKKPAPVGTPLTDTEYWTLYGASSGAIINLQNQIDTIKNTDIPGLQGQIDTINNTDLPAIDGKIGTLSNLKTPVKTDIVNAVNSMLERKVICISDSYGTYPDGTSNWMVWLKTALKISASNFFSRAIGGSGFATGGETFQQQLENIAAGLTAQQKLEITDIVIGGGFNDAQNSNQADVYNAANSFYSYARTNFPNAKVYLAFIGWSFNSEWISKLKQYNGIKTYKELVVQGFNFVSGAEYCMRGKGNFTQEPEGATPLNLGYFYGHPNSAGALSIGICIANYIKSGSACKWDNAQYYLVSPILATGVTLLSGDNAYYMEQQEDTISVIKDGTSAAVLQFSTPKNITTGLLIEIGKFADGLVAGLDSSLSGARPISQMLFNGEVYQSGWKTVTGSLFFMNNRLYAYVMHPEGNAIESLAIFSASGHFPANAC